MSGIRALRRIQIGAESTSTPGTAVAATTALRMVGTIEDQRTVVFPPEDVGILTGTDRQYTSKYLAAITTEGELTFEQGPYFCEAGIAHTTGTTDTGTGWIYTYNISTTAQGQPRTYTIEGGDDQEAEEMSYSFCKDVTFSGNAGEAWMVSANWYGRQASTCTFTASTDAAIPTVEEVLFSKTKLYARDSTAGAVTSTTDYLQSNTLLSAEYKLTSGYQEVFTADGELYFSYVKQVAPEIVLTITYEHDATGTAEKDAWRAGTSRQIRLEALGSALTTPGTHTYKTFRLDAVGKWEKFDKIDEQDGNDIIKGTFRGRYNPTRATAGGVLYVNELSTLP